MNAAANDARVARGDHFITPLDGFANFYDHLANCDRDRDLFIVEVNGRIIGYGRTEWHDVAEGRIHDLICFLHPDWRRRGIGRAILETLETRAIAVLADHPAVGPAFFEGYAQGEVGEEMLFTRAGYEAVRHGYTMVRPNLDPVPDAALPDGLEVRPVRDEHLRQIYDAAVEAFRDAWGFYEPAEGDWQ